MGQTVTVAAILAYGASIYGWGTLITRWAFAPPQRHFALTIAVGLAGLSFVGSFANLFHIAYPPTIDILVLIGWLLLAADLFRIVRQPKPEINEASGGWPVATILIGAVLISASVTLLPSRTLNIFDDFFLYLVSPVRALQTGTLGGNPFESAGATTLGTPAFFQSFILAHFGIEYLPAFDNVFCLVLTLALTIELARHTKLSTFQQIAVFAAALVFNPQIVNSTAVYSASALLLAFFLAVQIAAAIDDPARRRRAMIVAGLLGGGVISLKSTFIIPVGIICVCFFAALGYGGGDWRRALRDIARVAVGGAGLLIPWALVYIGDYDVLWRLHTVRQAIDPAIADARLDEPTIGAMFSLGRAFFGGHLVGYTILFALTSICGLYAAWQLKRLDQEMKPLAALTIAQAGALLATFAATYQLAELNITLRYVAPIALGCAVVAAIFVARAFSGRRHAAVIGLIIPSAVIALFATNFLDRVDWAMNKRSQIAFESGREPPVTPYLDATIAHSYDSWIQGLQARIPPGAGILTWHPFAFLMDFRRNPIMTLNDGAYHNPLFSFPVAGNFDNTTRALRDIGIDYVIWEHTGLQQVTQSVQNWPALTKSRYDIARKQAQSGVRATAYMQYLSQTNAPIYSDGRIVVFRLAGRRAP